MNPAPASAAQKNDLVIKNLDTPPDSSPSPFYTGNRAPLIPARFYKLPIGSITPAAGCGISSSSKPTA